MNNYHKNQIERVRDSWKEHRNIPIEDVFVLKYMADNDIYPDGTFSDDEVILWEAFRKGGK